MNNRSVQQSQYSSQISEGARNLVLGGANISKDVNAEGDGDYVALLVEHEGDTRGTPWYTYVDCIAVNPKSQAGRVNIPVRKLIVPEG